MPLDLSCDPEMEFVDSNCTKHAAVAVRRKAESTPYRRDLCSPQ